MKMRKPQFRKQNHEPHKKSRTQSIKQQRTTETTIKLSITATQSLKPKHEKGVDNTLTKLNKGRNITQMNKQNKTQPTFKTQNATNIKSKQRK